MKEASDVISGAGDRLDFLSGEGDLFLPLLTLGATGGILTVPNVAPAQHVRMYEAFQCGDLNQARHLNQALQDFSLVLSVESKYHAAIKAALHQVGLPVGPPRRPLTDVSPAAKAAIGEQLVRLGLRNA
jgi:4-hydroxy-tetrahydrodipicolinate synthase